MVGRFTGLFCFLVPPLPAVAAERAELPFRVHRLESPFQAAETTLRVLVPDEALIPDETAQDERYRVLFVLPVHEDGLFKHGDGLEQVRKANVHNQHRLICVAPSFTSKPWYADHDQNPKKRDESHLLKTVIPFVEQHYPVRKDRDGRLLVGFSKSGWGALTLLLRHPEMFHRAAAWDPGVRVDTGPFANASERRQRVRSDFGSDQNFEQYRITKLLKANGKQLGKEARLFYFNCDGNQRTQGGAKIHQLLVDESVPHRYVMEPRRDHRWDSGWLPEAIKFLVDGDD